jgi:hypothetical protein
LRARAEQSSSENVCIKPLHFFNTDSTTRKWFFQVLRHLFAADSVLLSANLPRQLPLGFIDDQNEKGRLFVVAAFMRSASAATA